MITTNVEVLQDNRLIGTHVYQRGDVASVTEERAKELIKLKHVVLTNKPVTQPPLVIPRSEQIRAKEEAALVELIASIVDRTSEQIRAKEEAALDPAPARAQKATAKPSKTA